MYMLINSFLMESTTKCTSPTQVDLVHDVTDTEFREFHKMTARAHGRVFTNYTIKGLTNCWSEKG